MICTQYKLVFKPAHIADQLPQTNARTAQLLTLPNVQAFFSIALSLIFSIEVRTFVREVNKQAHSHCCIEVYTKDGRRFNFILKDVKGYERCNSICKSIKGYTFLDKLDADNILHNSFTKDYFKAVIGDDLVASVKTDALKISELNAAAWNVYADPIVEFKRQGVKIDTEGLKSSSNIALFRCYGNR